MFKSKLFLKALFVMSAIILIYMAIISFFILPKASGIIKNLEEEKAKVVLSKVVTLSNNVAINLQNYKLSSEEFYKNKLKDLTQVALSIVKTKYEESKPENIGIMLKLKGDEFKKNLLKFYNKNKNKMSKQQLKQAIKDYVNIHRYDNNTGYFFINKGTTTILHPIKPSLNGKDAKNLKDKDGVYFIRKFAMICDDIGSGIVKYKWENPKSGKIEEKISYVFKFEPFNWIIGTGEYYSVLNQKLKNEVIELVNKLRYDNNNYFFISNYQSKLISHPYLQGKDFSKIKDKKGHLVIPPLVKIAREKGEGFYSYWWPKNNSDPKPYQKLTFAKDFPNWKMVINTGVYIDDIDKEIQRRKDELIQHLQRIIKATKIGKTGYLYIFDGKGNMLIHPNSNIVGKNILKLKNPGQNTYIFDDLVKAAKEHKALYYKWDKPSDKGNYIYPKVSWIKYIPQLDWYVCSSAYVNELTSKSTDIKYTVLIYSFLVLLISLLLATIFIRKILKPLTTLSSMANEVANGNYDVKADIKTNDEIGILAKDFNTMVDNIDNLIKTLDKKVELRTQDVEKQKNISKP
jgi:signal transduction histidine kinase